MKWKLLEKGNNYAVIGGPPSQVCSFWQKIDKIIRFWELAPPPQENPGSATGYGWILKAESKKFNLFRGEHKVRNSGSYCWLSLFMLYEKSWRENRFDFWLLCHSRNVLFICADNPLWVLLSAKTKISLLPYPVWCLWWWRSNWDVIWVLNR